MSKKLERYVALVRLWRDDKTYQVGQWVRLEPETGEILGLAKAVPESAIDTNRPRAAVVEGIIQSGACFADGALLEVKRSRGLSTAKCKALVRANAREFIEAHGSGLALVKGVTGDDLKGWAE
jgi:hypothetical protein